MASHNELGKKGEQLALEYLQNKSFRLVEKNWRHHKDEIDLIFTHENTYVFVEVKTRESTWAGEPEELVTLGQQKRIIRAADAYMIEKDLDFEVRFDAVGVIINQHQQNITHLEEAFSPHW